MIRPFTCLCLMIFIGSGLYLYQYKHQAQLLDRDIARTLKEADASRARANLLRAEYALLNDPSRLEDLSGQLLPALRATAPNQFTIMAELSHRLPPVGAAPPPPPLEPDAPAAELPPPAAAPEFARPEANKSELAKPEAAKPEAPRPEPAKAEPVRVEPPKPPLVAAATPRPPAPAPRPAPQTQMLAQTWPAIQAVPPAAQPRPAVTAVPRPAPVSVPPPTPITRVAASAPTDTPAPMVGSALGMARRLAPQPAISNAFAPVSSGGNR